MHSTLISSTPKAEPGSARDVIVTPTMKGLGYAQGLPLMKAFGFFKRDDFLWWETPFGTQDALEQRHYIAQSPDGSKQWKIIDASYLVEPEPGLWLLSIDANVYRVKDGTAGPESVDGYSTSNDTGWNALLTEKPFMLPWVRSVVDRAKQQNKQLLVFSHYPLVDFLDGTQEEEKQVFGNNSFLKRTPRAEVAEQAIAAGIRLHFSGHLHVNDTGVFRSPQGSLVNIAVPSLAAYPPAMKLATLHADRVEINTLVLRHVPNFNHLFPFYRKEIAASGEHALETILHSQDYYQFLHNHLALLVRERFLPREWPKTVVPLIKRLNCADLLWLATQPAAITAETLPPAEQRRIPPEAEGLEAIPLLTLVTDWYCLRNGSDLAWKDIPTERVSAYRTLFNAYRQLETPAPDSLQRQFGLILKIFAGYMTDQPATQFTVDLNGNLSAQ